MNILFWNTLRSNRKHIDKVNDCIIDLISEKECDIVILAEYNGAVEDICHLQNVGQKEEFCLIPNFGGCDRIRGLIKKKYQIKNLCEQTHYQISIIETSLYKLIIAMIHNRSKLYGSEEIQKENLRRLHYDICEEERKHNTQNSIIIGDFNANPFEPSFVSANSLHAIPFLDEVKKNTRIVLDKEYQKFYNPTWKFFGKRETPYSTYYYNNSDMYNIYWNVFDQIIIRPQLIEAFIDDSLTIIHETKNHSLLRAKKPDKENYSDHLPLFCALEEGKIK